jgi:uncharacterized protein
MSGRLHIIAKAPRAGEVKTRLARAIGAGEAARLYAAFLTDLGARFAGVPFPCGWYVTPAGAWAEISPLLPAGATWPVREQPPGDLTHRQRHLLREEAGGGATVVLVASDSPQLEVATVTSAFELLRRNQLVLGPTFDGGYYLIGMRGWHDVLDGATMGGSDAFDQVCARAASLGVSAALLPPTFDVDEAPDLELLRDAVEGRADLVATASVLSELGLARRADARG